MGIQRCEWKEGEGVLFDDTYVHEVWNKTDERRVVLFLDIYRDESLPRWIRPLNRTMTKILTQSKKVQKAAKKAEISLDSIDSVILSAFSLIPSMLFVERFAIIVSIMIFR